MEIISIKVRGETGREYEIKAANDKSLWCTCTAWRFQRDRPANERSCKHIEFLTRQAALHFAKVHDADAEARS